jgi:ATP-dependent DNA helicase DinG
MSNILLNFPEGFSPRERQITILKRVDEAFKSGKKFIIIDAPTGSGKTHTAKTIANTSKVIPEDFKDLVDSYEIFSESGNSLMDGFESFGSYSLTITKSLQDQYNDTFPDTGILKGQSNYRCDVDEDFSVDIAPCIYMASLKRQCWTSNRCPYYNKRNEMLKSHFSSLNYSMFFSLPEHLKRREILICDEGSELEEQLVAQFTCDVDIPFLMRCGVTMKAFPSNETVDNVKDWISNLSVSISKVLESLKDKLGDLSLSKDKLEFEKKRQEYSKLNTLSNKIIMLDLTYKDSQYLIERIEKSIRFTPLKVDVLSKYLFKYADKVVIMSATIIDPKSFCKSLGITDYEYISVDSGFDPEKAPIHVMTKQKLNYKNLKDKLPDLIKQINDILKHHGDEKGIIHTHTQYITDYVRDKIKSDRLLCRETGVKNEDILEIHERSDEPTVLVSPSMTYGIDLKGDLAKFQIIMKAPWLPTNNIRISKLMKLDNDWYSNMMLKTLVQSCGRGVRTEEDECVTYILDGSIYDAVKRNRHKLPKFFLDRFN